MKYSVRAGAAAPALMFFPVLFDLYFLRRIPSVCGAVRDDRQLYPTIDRLAAFQHVDDLLGGHDAAVFEILVGLGPVVGGGDDVWRVSSGVFSGVAGSCTNTSDAK